VEEKDKKIIIEIDKEFLEILKKLETKIKNNTWEGLEKVGYKSLTRILARKIIASKII
jgi:hypothetical protein